MTSSLRGEGGVAAALERVRMQVLETVRDRAQKARDAGRHDLSDEAINSLAHLAAQAAKAAAADGIGDAYQMGVNRSVTVEDHTRPTVPPPKPVRE